MSSELHINLGIDFGTSYTKVCYRNLGWDSSGIITFNGKLFVPSIVRVDERGLLSMPITCRRRDSQDIPFLKMRIGANYNLRELRDERDSPQVNLRDAATVEALCSYYVANVIRSAKREFKSQEFELTVGREIRWSANVGVPVELYDSPTLPKFRRVFSIAWRWETSNSIPDTLGDAIDQYRNGQSEDEPTDCHAVPEIVAAVWSFVTSREAQDGVYTYFDVGGGTVDGVCFKYETHNGIRRIRCYSGKVEPLGVSEIARRLAAPISVRIAGRRVRSAAAAVAVRYERELSADKLPGPKLSRRLKCYKDELQTLVARVIMTGKAKGAFGEIQGQVSLPIFLGGGGSRSGWYRNSISNTYFSRQHYNSGFHRYEMIGVPLPQDLKTSDVTDVNFPRFTVAYGLSVPMGEAPSFDLPGVFPKVPRPRRRRDASPHAEGHQANYPK